MHRLTTILRRATDALPFAILGIYFPLCVVAIVLHWDVYIGLALLLMLLASPVVGAAAIWCGPRWLNRRDDPRHWKETRDRP
jgi:hypothetical protein